MNFDLLRPVVFAELKVGDTICNLSSPCLTVKYKAPYFAVIGYKDGSEETRTVLKLEEHYRFNPLCWVEGKPVYPGDELYRPAVEGDKALVVSHTTRFESGVEYLHFSNVAGPAEYADNRCGYLTWTKPEPKAIPSFQVEGQDVFPGDTVYYCGKQRSRWGVAMTVKEGGQVLNEKGYLYGVADYEQGAATFCLKPMIVIGDHLVPMPVRDAAEMKNGDCYYIPSPVLRDGYAKYVWSNHSFDFEVYDKGLVHQTKEAASAHTKAFIALSKKKD